MTAEQLVSGGRTEEVLRHMASGRPKAMRESLVARNEAVL
jgi:hypothetical protein